MKKFIVKVIYFVIPIFFFFVSTFFIPSTPKTSKSLLFATLEKDSLLQHTPQPRILFVGGSNLSFGLNSQVIKDSLNLNPINTGLHLRLGSKFMLENTLSYLKSGDIIIIAFEYEHFYRPYEYTSNELFRTVVDVSYDKIQYLSYKQVFKLIKYIPNYAISKVKPTEYYGFKESKIYGVNSFNKFGDVDAHWNLKKEELRTVIINGNYNSEIINKIIEFKNKAEHIGANVYITFPSIDEISFQNNRDAISLVEKELRNSTLKVLGNSERYVFPRDMIFNTGYHLTKEGLEFRTQLLIEDIMKQIH